MLLFSANHLIWACARVRHHIHSISRIYSLEACTCDLDSSRYPTRWLLSLIAYSILVHSSLRATQQCSTISLLPEKCCAIKRHTTQSKTHICMCTFYIYWIPKMGNTWTLHRNDNSSEKNKEKKKKRRRRQKRYEDFLCCANMLLWQFILYSTVNRPQKTVAF